MKELLYKALENRLLSKITANEFLVLLGYVCEKNDINTFEHTFNISYRTVQNLRPHLCQLGLFDKDGRQYMLNVENTRIFLQQFVDSEKLAPIVDDSEKLAPIVDDSEKLAPNDNSEKLAPIVDDSEKIALKDKSSVEDNSSINGRNSTDVKLTMNDIPTDVLADTHKPTFQEKWGDVDPWKLDADKARELVEDIVADDDDDVSDKLEQDPNHLGIYRPKAKLISNACAKPSYPSIELDGVEDKLSYMKNYFTELHSYPNGGDDWIAALNALKEACGGFTECLEYFEVDLGGHTIKAKHTHNFNFSVSSTLAN